jgi:hypothetical protein
MLPNARESIQETRSAAASEGKMMQATEPNFKFDPGVVADPRQT